MYSKILVPVDGSETSTAGLNEAIKLAKIHGSQLCLMDIVNNSSGLYLRAQAVQRESVRGPAQGW
jgi:nucleotide-binding universal stress UspA family protein